MRNALILTAGAGSAALLIGALGFQYLGELPPCKLCIWQRWPHLAAVLLAGPAVLLGGALLPFLGAIAALATAGIGLYHTGIERDWWQGPTSCTSGPIGDISPEELLNQILAAPVVQCDQIAWEMLGLSMASWNALASLALAGLWLLAVRQS